MSVNNHTEQMVSLQLSQATLLRLIKENAVRVGDFQCLDKDSKETVRQSFMQSVMQFKS